MNYLDRIKDFDQIKVIMINEIVPNQLEDDFYSSNTSAYFLSVKALFNEAGYSIESVQDLLNLGIYLTNAVKTPKRTNKIEAYQIEDSQADLTAEIEIFHHLKVIMLMGDVAKKMVNKMVKEKTKQNVIPTMPTYKCRHLTFYYENIRVIPSYIMTGKNILIEKSKFNMIAEDIKVMMDIINK